MWYFGLWHHLLSLPTAESPPPRHTALRRSRCSRVPAAARSLPHGKHNPSSPTPPSLCRADVSYPERHIAIVHHSCVWFASAAPTSVTPAFCLWGRNKKLVWMSPPPAPNQWQRLLHVTSLPPWQQPIRILPRASSWQSTFRNHRNHRNIAQRCIALGIEREHAWCDILPRVDWDFIQQLTAGTYTLCWTWMLGETISFALV